jgi:hypothetical protein
MKMLMNIYITDPEECFRIEYFSVMINGIKSNLKTRLESLN